MHRTPMSPAQYDAACRVVESENPGCWVTSGYRNPEHNAALPGSQTASKHAMLPCMARDFNAETEEERLQIAATARRQRMWVQVHNSGTGRHVHTQGLPVGPPTLEWMQRWGGI